MAIDNQPAQALRHFPGFSKTNKSPFVSNRELYNLSGIPICMMLHRNLPAANHAHNPAENIRESTNFFSAASQEWA
jgi:hypothetical protein